MTKMTQPMLKQLPKQPAFLLDVDRTITNYRGEVTERTRQAIKAVQAKGLTVGLCTGRMYPLIQKEILALFSQAALHIFYGGGMIATTQGQAAYVKQLPGELIKKVAGFVDKQQGRFLFCQGDTVYTNDLSKEVLARHSDVKMVSPKDLADWSTPLITISDINAEIQDYIYQLEGQLTYKEMINYVQQGYFDLTAKHVNKAAAAKIWAEQLHLDLENVVAVGDSTNDLEVLQTVGFGVAMGNAVPELKAIAAQVIGHTQEDGLAQFLEQFSG